MKNEIEEKILKKEENLSKYSSKSKDAIYLKKQKEDPRPNYFHDADKIIYSLAYTRYIDKTQVFSYGTNDHITKRIIHVTMVSKIARTIGRFLSLNEDLIEAIALGHDIGHVPIGHVGEHILNEISLRELNEPFMHNVQSVRVYLTLDNNGNGSNISVQTLDGILAHNGEILSNIYTPKQKTKEEFLNEYKLCYKDITESSKIKPMTLEGCVVRISDVIGYVGKDVEDAITLGIIKRSDIPKEISKTLGDNNSDIINNIVLDIVKNSYNKPYIKMSDNVFKALEQLQKFNYKNIYEKANNTQTINKYKEMFNTLFSTYLHDLEYNNKDSTIYKTFLDHMNTEYKNTNNKRIVIDFISGMTDRFFETEYQKCVNKK